ncbi:MAG: sigma-70 family RNA polymerase sigma factor, partial [Ruminococcus sp.]|nr:sigma-70 family RNA polymerase sigma factor [Ruminococcus sp.]
TPTPKINNKKLTKNVIKAQNGDKKALEYIINETGSYVYYYCLSLLKDEEKTNDAVQDIYITILNKLSSVENPKAFLGWLKIVTANYCKDIFIKTRVDEELTEDIVDTDIQSIPEKSVETDEICSVIRSVVNDLPNIQKECVLLYYYQQLSIKEISDVLEVKEGTVKSRLYTARKAIKHEFEKIGKENLLALTPASYIAYTLINEAEKYKCSLAPKSVFALKTFSTKGGFITVAKTTAVSSTSIAFKVVAIACATAIVGSGGIFTYNLVNSKPEEQNTLQPFTVAQVTESKKVNENFSDKHLINQAKSGFKTSKFNTYGFSSKTLSNTETAEIFIKLVSDKKYLKINNFENPTYLVFFKNSYKNYIEKIPKSFDINQISSLAIQKGYVWKDEKGVYRAKYPYLALYSIAKIDAVTGVVNGHQFITIDSKEDEAFSFYKEIYDQYGINKEDIKWKKQ